MNCSRRTFLKGIVAVAGITAVKDVDGNAAKRPIESIPMKASGKLLNPSWTGTGYEDMEWRCQQS